MATQETEQGRTDEGSRLTNRAQQVVSLIAAKLPSSRRALIAGILGLAGGGVVTAGLAAGGGDEPKAHVSSPLEPVLPPTSDVGARIIGDRNAAFLEQSAQAKTNHLDTRPMAESFMDIPVSAYGSGSDSRTLQVHRGAFKEFAPERPTKGEPDAGANESKPAATIAAPSQIYFSKPLFAFHEREIPTGNGEPKPSTDGALSDWKRQLPRYVLDYDFREGEGAHKLFFKVTLFGQKIEERVVGALQSKLSGSGFELRLWPAEKFVVALKERRAQAGTSESVLVSGSTNQLADSSRDECTFCLEFNDVQLADFLKLDAENQVEFEFLYPFAKKRFDELRFQVEAVQSVTTELDKSLDNLIDEKGFVTQGDIARLSQMAALKMRVGIETTGPRSLELITAQLEQLSISALMSALQEKTISGAELERMTQEPEVKAAMATALQALKKREQRGGSTSTTTKDGTVTETGNITTTLTSSTSTRGRGFLGLGGSDTTSSTTQTQDSTREVKSLEVTTGVHTEWHDDTEKLVPTHAKVFVKKAGTSIARIRLAGNITIYDNGDDSSMAATPVNPRFSRAIVDAGLDAKAKLPSILQDYKQLQELLDVVAALGKGAEPTYKVFREKEPRPTEWSHLPEPYKLVNDFTKPLTSTHLDEIRKLLGDDNIPRIQEHHAVLAVERLVDYCIRELEYAHRVLAKLDNAFLSGAFGAEQTTGVDQLRKNIHARLQMEYAKRERRR